MRVLVAEDETRMSAMLQRGLAEDGYSVDLTADGLEALWQATEVDYDVIVLDLMLPGIDGFEVCRRLRAANRWAPVLILTARTEVADRVHGLDCGADDYLAKPFSFMELTARLRALIRRGCQARPAVLTAGSLRLDPATRTAWRGDALLDLMRRAGFPLGGFGEQRPAGQHSVGQAPLRGRPTDRSCARPVPPVTGLLTGAP